MEVSVQLQPRSFHSINFPSEWGVLGVVAVDRFLVPVSIQLISPASGE